MTPAHKAQLETDDRHLHPKQYPTTTGHTPERRMDNIITVELNTTKDTAATL
jgi:hypothetical protein